MLHYLDGRQERFFTWCDRIVQTHIERSGAAFKAWWPRKNMDGSYELILELMAHDRSTFLQNFSIPEEFHELLEREYFIDHPPDGHRH